MNEDEILEKYYYKNPFRKNDDNYSIKKEIYLIGEGKKQKYNLFSWITGNTEDIWVSALYLTDKLKPYGLTPQLYYDIVILGIKSTKERPRCRYCEKSVGFKNMSRGYFNFCDLSCTAKWGNKVPSKIKNVSKALTGKKLSKEHRESLSRGAIKRIQRSGLGNSGYYNTRHGKYKPEKSSSEINYCSSWELDFMKYCDRDDNVELMLPVERIPYRVDGVEKNYLPDFKLKLNTGIIVIIEIKPCRLQYKELNLQKRIAGKIYARKNGYKYIVLTENQLFNKKRYFYLLDYII